MFKGSDNVVQVLYGPLYSRRLGVSVGIDIIPYKTCSYNCVYCHEGETTRLTCQRQDFLEPAAVLEALASLQGKKRFRNLDLDYLTFAGSGEPTLNHSLGKYIRYLKEISPVPVAVLTNSSLLWDQDLREELAAADLVVPSLDAGSELVFQRLNRPCPGLSLARVTQGLQQFCQAFPGQTWLEILLCRGINDSEEELRLLARTAAHLEVDRIQINTVSRPPALPGIFPATPETLTFFQQLLGPGGEIVHEELGGQREILEKDLEKAILDCLRYQPGNVKSLSRETKKSGQEVIKVLSRLEKQGILQRFMRHGKSFYRILD